MQRGMGRWFGRVAIVTGANSGIGAAISKNLVENGLQVVGVSRAPLQVELLSAQLENAAGKLYNFQCDVTKEEEISKVIKWARSSLGGVHVLVNNAGVFYQSPLRTMSAKKMEHLFEVNVFGLSNFTRLVVNEMLTHGIDDGHIFHVTGITGHKIIDFQSGIHMYSASKHAVKVLTEGMRRELRDIDSHICITGINPGVVRTDLVEACGMTEGEVGKIYAEHPALEPEDVADAVAYALSVPPNVQVHDVTLQPVGQKF